MRIECAKCGNKIISDCDLNTSKNLLDGNGVEISECKYCGSINFTIVN